MTAAALVRQPAVLIVDDEWQSLQSYELLLRCGGIEEVVLCDDSRNALDALAYRDIGVVVLDLIMPHLSGETLLPDLLESYPEAPVIVLTGAGSVESAVRCMRHGVFDYLVKPVEESRLLNAVRRALELRALRRENSRLSQRVLSGELERPDAFSGIITQDSAMRAMFRYVEAVAESVMPLLITGETGVGKELVARVVHELSERPGQFVPVNIAGLDDSLFSDTLFGHERGAFTGAESSRAGLIEQARGGTLFLDEIGDLSPPSQVKLLRVLQEREYMRVGSDVPRMADARVLAATNQDAGALLSSGSFRKDLFYRLQTHHVRVPPLRERPGDIPLLARVFSERAAERLGKLPPSIPDALSALLSRYSFPGNVRELQSMIVDAVSHHQKGPLSQDFFRLRLGPLADEPPTGEAPFTADAQEGLFSGCPTLPTLKQAGQALIEEAMRRATQNQTAAARMLGISQSALSRRLNPK